MSSSRRLRCLPSLNPTPTARRALLMGALALRWPALLAGLPALAPGAHAAGLSQADAASGIRSALQRGAEAAVDLLGRQDGFLGNPQVRIPLPKAVQQAAQLLKLAGQQKKVDELETAMNRAAEAAVPEARALLLQAAKAVTLKDALAIVRGGDTSVTDYFSSKTRAPLMDKFLPIVTRATERVQLAQRYNAVAGQVSGLGLGLVKSEDANVQQYVTRKALDGLFLMIAQEEKKIRADPVGTGSALLKKVFGG